MKVIGAAVLAGLILAACGRSAPWPQAQDRAADAGDASYREPPQLRSARRTPDGGVALSGRALAGAAVRLASPDGRYQEARADQGGGWALTAPNGGPALYALSQQAAGRRDQADGYVAVLPDAGPVAAVLRAGTGALSMAGGPGRLSILAVDTDRSGVAIISGWASPNQPLRVLIDGAPADQGATGQDGRFALSLPKPLAPGEHAVQVVSPTGEARAMIEAGPPPVFAGVLHATPRDWGWRLDWATPAGGVQTTELFAAPGPGR
jgi:hypothetical protein